jgi:rhodanese-related sulfurtransferase
MTRRTLVQTLAMAAALPFTAQSALDTGRIEQLTGLKGALNKEEGVFKVSAPRNDVKIAVDGWTMPPFMGLTSWAAFKEGTKEEAMVMGDLVLFQDKSKPILVNCHAGSRGAVASAALAKLGFKTVCNLAGGLEAWEQAGHQAEK